MSVILDQNEKESGIDFKESDSQEDSDAMQLFELPKRKIIRPLSSFTKRKLRERHYCSTNTKKCFKVFCYWVTPLLLALFIVSTSLCLMFLLSGISSMKEEIHVLQIRLKNADAIQMEFNVKNKQLHKDFADKLLILDQYKYAFNNFADKINAFSLKIDALNSSTIQMQTSISLPLLNQVASIIRDIDTLKTGMADTGSEIEQLAATSKVFESSLGEFKHVVDMFKMEILNISATLNMFKSMPSILLATTPKAFVNDEDKLVKHEELSRTLEVFRQSQRELIQNNTNFFLKELDFLNKTCIDMVKNVSAGSIINQEVLFPNRSLIKKEDTIIKSLIPAVSTHQNVTSEFNLKENEKFQVSKIENNLNNGHNLEQANKLSNRYKGEHDSDSANLNPIEVNVKQAENEDIEMQDRTLKLLSEIIKEPTKPE